MTPKTVHVVNAPPFAEAAVVAGHSPADHSTKTFDGHVHYRCDKATRVAAPGLTSGNRTAAIGADRAIVATHQEAAANSKNILKRIPTVNADLQHAAVKSKVGVLAGRVQVKVVTEC